MRNVFVFKSKNEGSGVCPVDTLVETDKSTPVFGFPKCNQQAFMMHLVFFTRTCIVQLSLAVWVQMSCELHKQSGDS